MFYWSICKRILPGYLLFRSEFSCTAFFGASSRIPCFDFPSDWQLQLLRRNHIERVIRWNINTMSTPCATNNSSSDSGSKKPEELRLNPSISSLPNDDSAKTRVDQPITNGALPHELKTSVGNGHSNTTVNGQEERPASDSLHREVPDLLPLQPITSSSPPPLVSAGPSSAPSMAPVRQPPPPLLPMSVVSQSPVVATKSAPPPAPAPAAKATTTTRGQKASSPVPTLNPAKEHPTPASPAKSKTESEEPSPIPEEAKETKKRKPVSKKRDSIASSGNLF